MSVFFLKLVNLSITASYLVLAVMLLRLLLKKAPRRIVCILWGLVALRLICPFSLSSIFSLVPSGETLPQEFLHDSRPQINSGIEIVDHTVNPVISKRLAPTQNNSADQSPAQTWIAIFSLIWLTGVMLLLFRAFISWVLLRKKVCTAVLTEKHIKQSEFIDSPFVMGMLHPTIYLPYHMDDKDRPYVIAHENAHIRRKDPWWKLLGFLLLCVYWFNPLFWFAYALFCRDIESACDETVIRDMKKEDRQAYSTALLNCSMRKARIAGCPLAFGETSVKNRIKNIMHYRKPARWLAAVSIIAVIAAAVCFLTVPHADAHEALRTGFDSDTLTPSQTGAGSETPTQGGADSGTHTSSQTAPDPSSSYGRTVFQYAGKEYNIAERLGFESMMDVIFCMPVGKHIVIEGHCGPNNSAYSIFDTETESFEKDLIGINLIWYNNDITTAVYSFWSSIYAYDGQLLAELTLSENDYICELRFNENHSEVIAVIETDENFREEIITLK